MTIIRSIIKKLLTQQDIEWGEGTVSQIRNGTEYTLNQMRTIYPINSLAELNALDTTKFKKAMLFSNGVAQFYYFDSGMWKKDAGVVVQVVEKYADLATIPAAKGQLVQTREYSLSSKVGSTFYIGVLGLGETNGGTTSLSSDPAYHWEEVVFSKENTFGLLGTGNEAAKLLSYANNSSIVELSKNISATGSNIRQFVDNYFLGAKNTSGSVAGIYRRKVIPYVSKSDDGTWATVVAAKHLASACKAANDGVIKAMLIGDSISTYNANSISRGDMLIETLKQALDVQFPSGVDFFNRSIGGANYAALFSNASNASIPWYTTNTVNWITDTYNAVLPNIVFIAFGMNDSSSLALYQIKDAVDFYLSRPNPPSVVLCTNLVPRPKSANVTAGTEQAIMDARDYSAGLVRTYAKYRGIGYLDFHRKLCKVQDGFDPVSSVFKTTAPITPVIFGGTQNQYISATPCVDFVWSTTFDDSVAGTLSGGGIVIDHAGGFIQITRAGATLGVAVYIDATLVFGTYYPATFSNTVTNWVIERKNGFLNIYKPDGAPFYGAMNEPVVNVKIPYPGGDITPVSIRGVGLLSATFLQGEYVKNKPSALNINIWGDEVTDQGYGGSGFNHPSNWVASHVYRPVVEGITFYSYVPSDEFKEVTLASGSAVSVGSNTNTVVTTLALTKGTWEVSGVAGFIPAATTNISALKVGVTGSGTSFGTINSFQQITNLGVPNLEVDLATPLVRFIVATTLTISLTVRPVYTVSTLTAYGYIRAKRI